MRLNRVILQTVLYDWFNYEFEFNNPVGNVKRTVLTIIKPATDGEKPKFTFALAVACVYVPPPTPSATPPSECTLQQVRCNVSQECISKEHVCDGGYDCSDKTDELECQQVTTRTVPPVTPPSNSPALSSVIP
jgi:Low-density lipoprotein receptor domain class A